MSEIKIIQDQDIENNKYTSSEFEIMSNNQLIRVLEIKLIELRQQSQLNVLGKVWFNGFFSRFLEELEKRLEIKGDKNESTGIRHFNAYQE